VSVLVAVICKAIASTFDIMTLNSPKETRDLQLQHNYSKSHTTSHGTGLSLTRTSFPAATHAMALDAFPDLLRSLAEDFEIIEIQSTSEPSVLIPSPPAPDSESKSLACQLDDGLHDGRTCADSIGNTALQQAQTEGVVSAVGTAAGDGQYFSRKSNPLDSPGFRAVPDVPSSSTSEDDDDDTLDPLERTARVLFDKFDLNGDGFHEQQECQALGVALNTQPPVTTEGYMGLCKELGVRDSDRGIPFDKFLVIYSDPSFGANLAEDYAIVFGKAPP
jgi:hypothetical protein